MKNLFRSTFSATLSVRVRACTHERDYIYVCLRTYIYTYTSLSMKLFEHSEADTGRKGGLGCIPNPGYLHTPSWGDITGLPRQQLTAPVTKPHEHPCRARSHVFEREKGDRKITHRVS